MNQKSNVCKVVDNKDKFTDVEMCDMTHQNSALIENNDKTNNLQKDDKNSENNEDLSR